jgi:aspartate/methionine/tyrosine aminotransferase
VIDAESAAIQTAFRRKRDLLVKRCRELGLKLKGEPQGTFYVFADLSGLPPSISDGMSFFKAALGEKVICVPGEFFDVNPGKRRRALGSRFAQHVRLSFGPPEDIVRMGCDRLEKMIRAAK